MSETAPEGGQGTGTDPAAPPADPGTGPEGQPQGAPEGSSGTEGEPDLAAQLAHWKEMARKNEQRARANSAAATRLKELEDADKTDAQKAQDELAVAIRERDEARADHARVMAAAAHDLPVELIDDLGTGTDEEISERAERLSAAINKRAQEIVAAGNGGASDNNGRNGQQTGQRPVEALRPGGAPSNGGTPNTAEDWFRKLVTGQP